MLKELAELYRKQGRAVSIIGSDGEAEMEGGFSTLLVYNGSHLEIYQASISGDGQYDLVMLYNHEEITAFRKFLDTILAPPVN